MAEVPSRNRSSKEGEEEPSDNKKSNLDEEEIAMQPVHWLVIIGIDNNHCEFFLSF